MVGIRKWSWPGRWTQMKYTKLQWLTFNETNPKEKATRWIYLYRSKRWRPRRREDVPRQPKTNPNFFVAFSWTVGMNNRLDLNYEKL